MRIAAALLVGDNESGPKRVRSHSVLPCPDRQQLLNALDARARAFDLKHHVNGYTGSALEMVINAGDRSA